MSETEPVTTPAAVESPPPIVDESPAIEADPFEDAAIQQFDRKYVEKLRKENAERRTQAKDFEDTFSPYEADEVDIWKSIIKLTAQDTKAGAEAMAKLAAALLEDGDTEGAEKVIEAAEAAKEDDELDRPLTKRELQEYLAAQDKNKADQDAVTAVQTEAIGLGYKIGTADYLDLLNRAKLNHDYDITKAHAARESEKQAIIDAYITERAAAGDKWIKSPGGTGQPPNEERPPADFKSAKASLKERLSKL